MNLKAILERKIKRIVLELWPETLKPLVSQRQLKFQVEYPKEKEFGDYSTNIAMRLALVLQKNPIEIGRAITAKLSGLSQFEKVVVVAPGFINFYLNKKWLANQVKKITAEGDRFGRNSEGRNKKVQVEFISANPTGPLHLGHGRGAFIGDVLANVLKMNGYRVTKEYYLNNLGKQIEILAESVTRRYLHLQEIKVDYPDYCYQGYYIWDLAKKLKIDNYKITRVEKLKDKVKNKVVKLMTDNIKRIVKDKLKIKFDSWFSEKSLEERGLIKKILEILKKKNLVYEEAGALWFKTKEFGDDKDRVLIKANAEQTYFLPDIAYHWNKFGGRKFDKVIDIWGADHHGYIGRMQSAMKALGFGGKLEIIIAQFVRLLQDKLEVKMSKRSGTYVTLEELIDEVGLDVTRFFFLMYAPATHLDFDLALAKKKSEDNPVYYVQYAYARICSIIDKVKKAKPKEIKSGNEELTKPEFNLIKSLIKFPELIQELSQSYAVHQLSFYALELATSFHDFYTQCRVIDEGQLRPKRFELVKASKEVLKNVLSLMGISQPQKM